MTTTSEPKDEATACPGWQALCDYRARRLTEAALRDLDTHLASCADCKAVLAELAEDGLDQRIAAAWKEASTVDPFERLLEGVAAETATAPPAAPSLGQRIGPYELLEELGAGGMGRVYKARHATIDQVVALKVVRLNGGFDPVRQERFRVEAEALARLDHPNITRLYSFDGSAGPYFTMQWVDGRDLAKVLHDGPLDLREAAELVRSVAGAVEYCHGQNVYHRDLKPRNILVRNDGAALVSDFGLAKLVDDEPAGLTTDNAVMGTPSYMAPEQAEGRNKEVGPRTDVYALGAILYECLTGKPPFAGADKGETLRLVREGALVAPSALRAGLPADLEAVCLKCLERDANQRYTTAREVADDLDNWLNGRPTRARPLGLVGTAWRALRRWAVPLTMGAVGLVMAALLVTVLFRKEEEAPAPEPGPSPEELRREALAAINAKLDRGEAATLIGDTGGPGYYRMVLASARSNAAVDKDGAFIFSTQGIALLELLPEARVGRYELLASLRHDTSHQPGEAGVYFSHRAFPHPERDIHFYLQFSFNSVAGPRIPEGAPVVKNPAVLKLLQQGSLSELIVGWSMGESVKPADFGYRSTMSKGPRIRPLGSYNGRWFTLRARVGPEGVQAWLDGEPLKQLPAQRIEWRIKRGLEKESKKPRLQADEAVRAFRPKFSPRGGVGLLVWAGSVAVKNVSIRPLGAQE